MTVPKINNPAQGQKIVSYFWLLFVILLVFSALCIFKSHPKGYSIFYRTWGFDHIMLYSKLEQLLFVWFCLLCILPYSNKLISTAIIYITDKITLTVKKKIFVFSLISILFSFVFYLLDVKYHFLGDFNIRMIQTMKKEFVATEYLTMRILYSFATLGARFGYTHEQLFKLYSYIAGGFFIFTSCLIADLTGKTGFQKVVFFLAQITSSLLLVFCGYVEIYATPVMLMTLYLYLGLRYLKLNKGFIPLVLILIIAIASHLLCLAALPSIFVAWYFNNKKIVPFISKMTNKKIAFLLSVLVFIALIIAFKTKSGFLLTFSPPVEKPTLLTLFDFRHFWELLNGQILCCGLSFIFIFILLFKSVREKKQLFSEHYFLLSVSGSFLLLIFIANLQRGSGDWDIMAFPAISLNLITILLIAHLYKNQLNLAHYIMVAILGINGANSFLWLHVNHTDKSILKIKKMLVNDPGTYYTARISGIVQLSVAYTNNKLLKEAEQASLLACNTSKPDDTRSCVMYALSLRNSKKTEEARVFFEDLLRNRTPYILEAYLFLLEHYEKKKDNVKFDYYLNLMFDSFCEKPDPFVGNMNFRKQSFIQLFEVLYKISSSQKKDQQRLDKIKTVIRAIKNYNPETQNKK